MENMPIKPLFQGDQSLTSNNKHLVQLNQEGYNKKSDIQLINAKNDLEAILTFLSEYQDSPETLSSYTKEIEHLLLWYIHTQSASISDLRRDDLLAYQTFLKNPK